MLGSGLSHSPERLNVANTEHLPIKEAEKIIATGAAVLEQDMKLPALFRREGAEQFKGAKDDKVFVTVDGVLPYRKYGWRNDRSTKIQYDTYSERKVWFDFGDDLYSGVKLTDEQANFDFAGFTKLVGKQVEALGRGLEYETVDAFDATPFEVVVTLDEDDLRGGLIQLRRVFNRLMVQGRRTVVCNDELEAALLGDEKLNLASNVGDEIASAALREAHIGRTYGFDFITANEMGTYSVAVTPEAYVLYLAAPAVPQSAWGASASVDGVALRWVKAFDIDEQLEKSVVSAYKSYRYVDDPLVARVSEDDPAQVALSDDNHFVRAVKVELGGAFSVELANEELETFTGLTSTDGVSDGS